MESRYTSASSLAGLILLGVEPCFCIGYKINKFTVKKILHFKKMTVIDKESIQMRE